MSKKPNILHIYADDLGRGMLSCYGYYDRREETDLKFEERGALARVFACVLLLTLAG